MKGKPMKKRIIPILLLCILLLAGCTRGQIYEFRLSGQEFVADLENKQVTVTGTADYAALKKAIIDEDYEVVE